MPETAITPEQIDALMPFLAALEDNRSGERHDADGHSPYVSLDEVVGSFVHAVYEHGWVVPFDWTNWQPVAERYMSSPESLRQADAETIRRLLTLHVRKDRFCEGHLEAMFESGHITALLRRLAEIRAGLE
jgi:hypothetical protein